MNPDIAANTLSPVLVALMKGVLWRDDHERLWHDLLSLQARVRDHAELLGLTLVIDEAEGYALLRQAPDHEERDIPRLVARRPLSFPVSLLLVLLRKKLVEADGSGSERRVVLRREELVEMMRQFLPATSNEARLEDQIGTSVNKVLELGFLRALKNRDGEFEVSRLLKTFVDAGMLESLLATYKAHAEGGEP